MARLRKLLAEVETDEDPVFENEVNGREDVLEENFSDHERFSEHDTESEEDGDSRNEEVNNSKWFSSKVGVQCRKTKFRQNIRTRCHNIMSRLTCFYLKPTPVRPTRKGVRPLADRWENIKAIQK
ncbi:hypothetical protein AVEN_144524-1 [Araneus ventricosus]|uniref:Uncharacterized protein n=1 Tax=Araneus ventricosus TaxID=182803 RepID=A0A4Y2W058_ARAVE|nr:hypothetical protein AVEN_144524-1 [Araneus ventricosus]